MPAATSHFSPALFRFVEELKANNNRPWFEANKARYEDEVKHPALSFISDFGPHLKKITKSFSADPRPVGGSLFRIYRDTRFGHDKSPYKTHIGIHFRHRDAKDAHAPGFYLHLDPAGCFAGIGIWRPDAPALAKLRAALVAKPKVWQKVIASEPFAGRYRLAGDSLKRPPKGFDPEHPLIEDLKRTDFVAVAELSPKEICRPGFLETYAELSAAGAPFVKFLCQALEVEW